MAVFTPDSHDVDADPRSVVESQTEEDESDVLSDVQSPASRFALPWRGKGLLAAMLVLVALACATALVWHHGRVSSKTNAASVGHAIKMPTTVNVATIGDFGNVLSSWTQGQGNWTSICAVYSCVICDNYAGTDATIQALNAFYRQASVADQQTCAGVITMSQQAHGITCPACTVTAAQTTTVAPVAPESPGTTTLADDGRL